MPEKFYRKINEKIIKENVDNYKRKKYNLPPGTDVELHELFEESPASNKDSSFLIGEDLGQECNYVTRDSNSV
jgi:hypothetical protein